MFCFSVLLSLHQTSKVVASVEQTWKLQVVTAINFIIFDLQGIHMISTLQCYATTPTTRTLH